MWKPALRRHKCVLVHFGLFPSELRGQHEKWRRGCKQRGQGPRASASQPAPDTAVVIPRKKLLSEKTPALWSRNKPGRPSASSVPCWKEAGCYIEYPGCLGLLCFEKAWGLNPTLFRCGLRYISFSAWGISASHWFSGCSAPFGVLGNERGGNRT